MNTAADTGTVKKMDTLESPRPSFERFCNGLNRDLQNPSPPIEPTSPPPIGDLSTPETESHDRVEVFDGTVRDYHAIQPLSLSQSIQLARGGLPETPTSGYRFTTPVESEPTRPHAQMSTPAFPKPGTSPTRLHRFNRNAHKQETRRFPTVKYAQSDNIFRNSVSTQRIGYYILCYRNQIHPINK